MTLLSSLAHQIALARRKKAPQPEGPRLVGFLDVDTALDLAAKVDFAELCEIFARKQPLHLVQGAHRFGTRTAKRREDIYARWACAAACTTIGEVDRYVFAYLDVPAKLIETVNDAQKWAPLLGAIAHNLPRCAQSVYDDLAARWRTAYHIDLPSR